MTWIGMGMGARGVRRKVLLIDSSSRDSYRWLNVSLCMEIELYMGQCIWL